VNLIRRRSNYNKLPKELQLLFEGFYLRKNWIEGKKPLEAMEDMGRVCGIKKIGHL